MSNKTHKTMTVKVCDLKAGDYVVAAKATVADVQCFAGVLAIVDFTDNTATPPVNRHGTTQVRRPRAAA